MSLFDFKQDFLTNIYNNIKEIIDDSVPETDPPSEEELNEGALNSTENQSDDPIEQQQNEEFSENDSNKEYEFTPTQLNQLIEPTIETITIEIGRGGFTQEQKQQFLTGMGQAPFVYYNGIHIEYKDISFFKLYHEGILPAIKIICTDRNGVFTDNGFPLDDTIISIFLYSRSERLKSIKMDFKITNFKDIGGQFSIQGIIDVPGLYLSKFQSYSKKSSFNALKELAKECKMGFCSNVSDTDDVMTWINPGKKRHEFIKDILNNSYKSDESYMFCYIDFFYNLCYVDLEKEYRRDNSNDKQISTDNKSQFTESQNQDEISELILSTDHSIRESNSWIEKYTINNKSTQISINTAYSTSTKFYDSSNKELLIFDIDSLSDRANESIVLKAKPQDEEFYKENIQNIWTGKYEPFNDGEGNVHNNFNYSPIQNEININEMSKIELNIDIPNPNFNIYLTQKVKVLLLKDAPGVNQSSFGFKRLDGNWIITDIDFTFDGRKYLQKVKLIKRELELSEDEKEKFKSNSKKSSVDNSQQEYENELSPFDEEPNNPTETETPSTGEVINDDGERAGNGVENQNMAPDVLGVPGDITKSSPSNYDIKTTSFLKKERKPTQIVLHFSAGWQRNDKCKGTVDALMSRNNNKGLTYHYIISVNGHIENLVDPKYQAYHGSNANPNSIGISIECLGNLFSSDSLTVANNKIDKYRKSETPWKKQEYGLCEDYVNIVDVNGNPITYKTVDKSQEISQSQVKSLEKLLRKLGSEYSISWEGLNRNNFEILFPTKGVSYNPSKPGLYTHASITTVKSDILPTPRLVNLLKRLQF